MLLNAYTLNTPPPLGVLPAPGYAADGGLGGDGASLGAALFAGDGGFASAAAFRTIAYAGAPATGVLVAAGSPGDGPTLTPAYGGGFCEAGLVASLSPSGVGAAADGGGPVLVAPAPGAAPNTPTLTPVYRGGFAEAGVALSASPGGVGAVATPSPVLVTAGTPASPVLVPVTPTPILGAPRP
jgi:hypothetical protein